MRRTLIAVMGLLLALPRTALAADERAAFVTKLFTSACIPNMSNPDGVRAWAAERHLAPVKSREALDLFAGPGDKGAAWMMTTAWGRFALSTRGDTEACAAWAHAADPAEVETAFKALVEGVRKPEIRIRMDKDEVKPTQWGKAHMLAYNLTAPGADSGFEFSLQTMEQPGGGFQAEMQVTHVTAD